MFCGLGRCGVLPRRRSRMLQWMSGSLEAELHAATAAASLSSNKSRPDPLRRRRGRGKESLSSLGRDRLLPKDPEFERNALQKNVADAFEEPHRPVEA